MKRHADGVITTFTSMPAFTNRRVSSAALYAAMPPVIPRTIRLSEDDAVIIRAAYSGQDARSLHCARMRLCLEETVTNGPWPQRDRPRERLLAHGARVLSDAELVSLLVHTGVAGRSAVDVARDAIARFGGLSGLLT